MCHVVALFKWKWERFVWYCVWSFALWSPFCTAAIPQSVVQLFTEELTNRLKHWNKAMSWKADFRLTLCLQLGLKCERSACLRVTRWDFLLGHTVSKAKREEHARRDVRYSWPQRALPLEMYFNKKKSYKITGLYFCFMSVCDLFFFRKQLTVTFSNNL